MAKNLGFNVRIGGDTTALDKALKGVNTTIKSSTSAIKELDKASKLNPLNISQYAAKQEELAKAISATKDKLKTLQDVQDDVYKQFKNGEISTEQWAKYKQELENTKKSLKELEAQHISVKSVLSDLGSKGLEATKVVGQGLATGVAALATASVAAATGIATMTLSAAGSADDLNTLAKTTGLSTEQLQKFSLASDLIDVSVDTLSSSLKKVTTNMAKVKEGNADMTANFKKLGVAVTDSNGALRDNYDVFQDTIRALGNISNETERDALAMEIFGKSATDLNPLIEGGIDDLEEFSKKAEEMGLILSQDALDGLNAVNDQMDTLKATIKGGSMALASEFAPVIENVLQSVNELVSGLKEAFQEGGLYGVVEYITKWLESLLTTINDKLPEFVNKGMEMLQSLLSSFADNSEDITDTIVSMILTMVNAITQNLPDIIEAGFTILSGIVKGLVDNFPDIMTAALDMIAAFAQGVVKSLPDIWEIGKNIVRGVWEGIKSMASWLTDKVKGFFSGIVDGVKGILGIASPSKVFRDEIGKYMAQGVGVGFEKELPNVVVDMQKALGSMTNQMRTGAGNMAFNHNIVINTSNMTEAQVTALSRRIVNDVSYDLGRRVYA